MTLQGPCFSRAPPFRETQGIPRSAPDSAIPLPSWPKIPAKSPIISPDRESKSLISRTPVFHVDPKGNPRGSKKPRQADNTPPAVKQAHNQAQTDIGSKTQ